MKGRSISTRAPIFHLFSDNPLIMSRVAHDAYEKLAAEHP
jgi:hypothetical protein